MMGTVFLILLFLGALVLLAGLLWGLFWFLVQAGVIVREAGKQPYTGGDNYRLEQGRDLSKPEESKVETP
jgi:hypothetical protein